MTGLRHPLQLVPEPEPEVGEVVEAQKKLLAPPGTRLHVMELDTLEEKEKSSILVYLESHERH